MSNNRSINIEEVLDIIAETVQNTTADLDHVLTIAKDVAALTAQVVDILKNSGVTLVSEHAGDRSIADRARVNYIVDTLLSAPPK